MNDGGINFSFNNLVGDYIFGDIGTAVMSGEYDNFSFAFEFPPEPAETYTYNGNLTSELEKTASTERLKMTAPSFNYSVQDAGDLDAVTLTNLILEVINNLANEAYTITGSYSIAVTNPGSSGSFTLTIDTPLQGLKSTKYLSSGTLTISDNNSNALVVITILSETLVRVEYDENGDGISEQTSELTHQELRIIS